MNGTELTDIRDRYEEFKAHGKTIHPLSHTVSYGLSIREHPVISFPSAWASMKEEQFNWTLSMIQKIVSYYEAIGMKVYEEVVPNKYVSTLLWCPKNNLFPNRTDSIFATGTLFTWIRLVQSITHDLTNPISLNTLISKNTDTELYRAWRHKG
jgi:hypothetical protein